MGNSFVIKGIIVIVWLAFAKAAYAWAPGGYVEPSEWQSVYSMLDAKCRATLYGISPTGPLYRVNPPQIVQPIRIASGVAASSVSCSTSVLFGVTNVWCWTNYVDSYYTAYATNGVWSSGTQTVYVAPYPTTLNQIDAMIYDLAKWYVDVPETNYIDTSTFLENTHQSIKDKTYVWSYLGPKDCDMCYDILINELMPWPDQYEWFYVHNNYHTASNYTAVTMLKRAGLPVWRRPVGSQTNVYNVPGYEDNLFNVHSITKTSVVYHVEELAGFERSTTVTPYRIVMASIVFQEERVILHSPWEIEQAIADWGLDPTHITSRLELVKYTPSYNNKGELPARSLLPSMWGLEHIVTTVVRVTPPSMLGSTNVVDYYAMAFNQDIDVVAQWAYGDTNKWIIGDELQRNTLTPQFWNDMTVHSNYGEVVFREYGDRSWVYDVIWIGYTNWTTITNLLINGEAVIAMPSYAGLSIEIVTSGSRYELTSDGAQAIWEPTKKDIAIRKNALNTMRVQQVTNVYLIHMDLYAVRRQEYTCWTNGWIHAYGGGYLNEDGCALVRYPRDLMSYYQPNAQYSNFVSEVNLAAKYTITTEIRYDSDPYGFANIYWPLSARLSYYASTNGKLYFIWGRGHPYVGGSSVDNQFLCSEQCYIIQDGIQEPLYLSSLVESDASGRLDYPPQLTHVVDVAPGYNVFDISLEDDYVVGPHQGPVFTHSDVIVENTKVGDRWDASADRPIGPIRVYFEAVTQ